MSLTVFDDWDDVVSVTRRAADLMEGAHFGVVDKVGNPYCYHPHRVATYVRMTSRWCGLGVEATAAAVVVALLHDTVEDTWINEEVLRDAGFPNPIVESVLDLTHWTGEARVAYWGRIRESGNSLSIPVKWADMIDHTDPSRMIMLTKSDRDRLVGKYTQGAACLNLDPAPMAWWASQSRSSPRPDPVWDQMP